MNRNAQLRKDEFGWYYIVKSGDRFFETNKSASKLGAYRNLLLLYKQIDEFESSYSKITEVLQNL